jgi:2,4-dienoyl-CoA reductase-like NADH-dependent reductase (Old Yellow Enzyme family)
MLSPGAVAFPHLMSPFSIGTTELRNRFVFQPHFTALMADDSLPNDTLRAYFVERAMGGAGLIVDGHMTVMVEGMMAPHYIKAWEEDFIPHYRKIVDEVHGYGTKIFGQVTHAGHTSLTEPPQVLWAPTQMPEPSSHHTTRAMDLVDIARTVKGFGDAARNIVATGADGIEIKIAHDGLLRSFASPFFNQRTDAYGGTFEKRMRLPIEVMGSIRDAIGPSYPIGVRLCLNEYTPFGYDLEYGLRMAEAFEATGLIDYFNCDAGTFSSFWMEIPPAAVEQGFFRPLNRALKQSSSLPVVAFGRIKQAELAERMIELGEADLIGMARGLIADPEIPRKLLEGRSDEIRACIGCNDGCIHQVVQVKGIRCIQNPAAGQERLYAERYVLRALVERHVVVVGGGPAGLKAAEIAARRGHRVTLLERDSAVGGQVRLAARQPLHEEVAEVTAYLEATVSRLGVEVWLNADADVDGLLELEPDVVIVATGSQPNLGGSMQRSTADPDAGGIARNRGLHAAIPLPGVDGPNVRSTDEILSGIELPGRRVLVIDAHGHWEAAGTAEYLADLGFEVEIVTDRPEPGFGLEATNRAMFLQRARAKGIRMTPLTEVRSLDAKGAIVVDVLNGTERRIGPVDVVVPVWPRASRDDLYFALLDRIAAGIRRAPEVLRIGDASAPRLIQNVLLEAHQIVMEL